MRKYQQLALLLISAFSVVVLILYKNENQRLKDVLNVVNIFGRTDEAVLRRLENATNDDEIPYIGPLPVWQALSENYHAYGVYWNRNALMAGGEALSIVVGKLGAVVNFGCSILYENGNKQSVRGKFHFQRADADNEDSNSEFTIYYFYCRIVRDFGNPFSILFNDLTNTKHLPTPLRLRHIKPLTKGLSKNNLNVCVNFVTAKRLKDENHLLQFFLHHQGLGVTDFLVYNGDELPQHASKLLQRFNMRLHLLPFNFPYTFTNATQRLRKILEMDCLIRNTNLATYATLLEANEFLYPNAKLDSSRSLLRSLNHYAGEISRFEVPIFSVCIDRKHKLLVDSTLYDPELKMEHKIFIYRAMVPLTTVTAAKSQSVALSLTMAFAHSYVDCLKVGKDGLHDWRNSLREDFMLHLKDLRTELDVIV